MKNRFESRVKACQRYLKRATITWRDYPVNNTLENYHRKLQLHRRVLLAELLLLRALGMKHAMRETRRGIELQTMNLQEVKVAIQERRGAL